MFLLRGRTVPGRSPSLNTHPFEVDVFVHHLGEDFCPKIALKLEAGARTAAATAVLPARLAQNHWRKEGKEGMISRQRMQKAEVFHLGRWQTVGNIIGWGLELRTPPADGKPLSERSKALCLVLWHAGEEQGFRAE